MFTEKELAETKKHVDNGELDIAVYESMLFLNQIQSISTIDLPNADTSVN